MNPAEAETYLRELDIRLRADALGRAVAIAGSVLALGEIERATYHPDGKRAESDTTHTVMLGLLAAEFAPSTLRKGLIAELALVHDLAEAIAGDTQTYRITAEERQAKEERERQASRELQRRIGYLSHTAMLLREYASQATPEARWVRLIDKLCPQLTRVFNGSRGPQRELVGTREAFRERNAKHLSALTEQFPEFADGLRLIGDAMNEAEIAWSPQ